MASKNKNGIKKMASKNKNGVEKNGVKNGVKNGSKKWRHKNSVKNGVKMASLYPQNLFIFIILPPFFRAVSRF